MLIGTKHEAGRPDIDDHGRELHDAATMNPHNNNNDASYCPGSTSESENDDEKPPCKHVTGSQKRRHLQKTDDARDKAINSELHTCRGKLEMTSQHGSDEELAKKIDKIEHRLDRGL